MFRHSQRLNATTYERKINIIVIIHNMFMSKQPPQQMNGFMRKLPMLNQGGFMKKLGGSVLRPIVHLQPYPQGGRSPARPLERL